MKKKLFLLACLIVMAGSEKMLAQTSTTTTTPTTTSQQTLARYGYFSYNAVLTVLPEYIEAQKALQQLRQQYANETQYNERNFKRMFAEFVQGQKNFPQNILLKRQQDLQTEMEKGIAFRSHCDSLIEKARVELEKTVRGKVEQAIQSTGRTRGYELMINTDNNTVPYFRAELSEDATPFINEEIAKIPWLMKTNPEQ